MRISPFWPGRGKSVPDRTARFHAVCKAADAIPEYWAHLDSDLAGLAEFPSPELALASLPLLPALAYFAWFPTRKPSRAMRRAQDAMPSALLLPYGEARRGLDDIDSYSHAAGIEATSDLFRLSRALSSSAPAGWESDHAVVVFSGLREGACSEAQRDLLWNHYQVPLFEHFLGPDAAVIATECEIHAGLHIRPESPILECVDGEVILTSLTDLACPALRVQTGLSGSIERGACDCGRVEPRLMQLRTQHQPQPGPIYTRAAAAAA